MTKQIKQLGSNHQLMVKDTKTGKTFVINKDDGSLGGSLGGYSFQEGASGYPLLKGDVPTFMENEEGALILSNFPLSTAVIEIYNEFISNTITTIIPSAEIHTLGSVPVKIVDSIPSKNALKGHILITYAPGFTGFNVGVETSVTFRFKDEAGNFLTSYTANANNLTNINECHWLIPLDSYLISGKNEPRSIDDLQNIYIQLFGEDITGGLLDTTLGDGELTVTVQYELISLS